MRPRTVIDENAVKIRFLNKDETLSLAPREIDLVPVIEVEITQGTGDGMIRASALALIDTGADHRVIDKSFAESLGLVSIGITSPSGVGGFVLDAKYYDLGYTVKTNGADRDLRGYFVSVPLVETGRKYQVLLGMSFLQKGRLIMDAKEDEYLFEFN